MKLRILTVILTAFLVQILLLSMGGQKETVPAAADSPSLNRAFDTTKNITLVMGDKVTTISTKAILVKDILRETDVEFKPEDRIIPGLEEPAADTIRIIDVKTGIIAMETDVPFPTEKKYDGEMFKGDERVIQKGKKGLEKHIFEVTYEDGQEVERVIREKVVSRAPVKQVLALGTRQTVSRSGSTLEFDRMIQMSSTGYTHTGRMTYTDIWPTPGIVAVDPRVIPLGTRLYIDGYGHARAMDTGGAIKGNRIDLFFDSREEALRWGRRSVKVFILK